MEPCRGQGRGLRTAATQAWTTPGAVRCGCEVAEAGARALRERRPLRPAGEAEAEQARVVVHAEASMGV